MASKTTVLPVINGRPVGRSEPPKVLSVAELMGKAYTEEMRVAFPDVPPSYYPAGKLILCQVRQAKKIKKLASGHSLILADETVDNEKFRVQTAIVRAMGPAAFRNRNTLEPWPEGDWCNVGDFIRVPLYGGDRIAVPYKTPEGTDDEVLFVAINDTDVTGVVIGDPLAVKTLL